jgi:hypothetical protein
MPPSVSAGEVPRNRNDAFVVYLFEMGKRQGSAPALEEIQRRLVEELPRPTPSFRRRAWLEFQRALDPLGPVKPLRRASP